MNRRTLTIVAVVAAAAIVIGAALAVVAITASTSRTSQSLVASSAACKQVNVVQAELHGVIARQSQGLSSNSYFKEHPDQLAKAETETGRELATFAPLKC